MIDRVRMLCLALIVCAAQGCVKQDDIREQRVPKQPNVEVLTSEAPASPHPAPTGDSKPVPGRILAGIVPVDDRAWFFKIMGASDPVAAQEDNFMALLKSLAREGNNLTWVTPDDWTEQPGAGMRKATFRFESEGTKLECSVIPLGDVDIGTPAHVLKNINRWRDQLGLEHITADDEPDETNQIDHFKLENGLQITAVNIQGMIAGSGTPPMMAGPNARPAGPAGPGLPPGHPPTAGSSRPGAPTATKAVTSIPDMSFDVPDGWTPKPNKSAFRKISWDLSRDGQMAEMYISTLSAGGSELAPNITRWRGQVGLDNLTGQALLDTVDEVPIGGIPGHVAEIYGEEQSILAAIVVRGATGWIFTLKSPTDIAKAEADNFRSFLGSVKFN